MSRPFSFSQLSLFAKCARAYYLRYERGIQRPVPFRLVEGNSYHKAMERGNVALLESRALRPAEFTEAFMADLDARLAVEEVEGTPHEIAEARDVAPPLLGEYARGVYGSVRPELVEYRFDGALDLGGSAVSFCGVVDVVQPGVLTDYKVVGRAHGSDRVRGSVQLLLYAHFVPRPAVEHIQLVRRKRLPEVLRVAAEPGRAARANALDWAVETVKAIEGCRRAGVWPRCDPESWVCGPRFCDYFGLCYRRVPAEEGGETTS